MGFYLNKVYSKIKMAPPPPRYSKISHHLNLTMKCLLKDGRSFVGVFKAFDKHMNLVLTTCTEFRRVRRRRDKTPNSPFVIKEEKRQLGMVVLRGEHIVSLSVEGGQQPAQSTTPSRSGPRSYPSSASRFPGSGYNKGPPSSSRSSASQQQSSRAYY